MNVFAFYTKLAREVVDLPEGWSGLIITTVGHPADSQGVIVKGAVCPPKTRGPDKGDPNWAKRDRSTVREVFVSREAYLAAHQALSAQSVNAEMGEGR